MPPQCCRCWSDLIEDDERGGSPLEYLNESLRRCKKSKKKVKELLRRRRYKKYIEIQMPMSMSAEGCVM